jgi:hypothetical protein
LVDIINWATKLTYTEIFNLLSFAFTVVTYIPYLISVKYNKDTRPTMISYTCWLVIDSSLLLALINSGQTLFLVLQTSAFVAGVILILSLTMYWGKGNWKEWEWADVLGVVIVALALPCWYYFKDPRVAIIMILCAGLGATMPMMFKLWKDPKREPMTAWVVVAIGGAFAVLGIEECTIVGSATQLTFFFLQLCVIAMMCRRYKKQ